MVATILQFPQIIRCSNVTFKFEVCEADRPTYTYYPLTLFQTGLIDLLMEAIQPFKNKLALSPNRRDKIWNSD